MGTGASSSTPVISPEPVASRKFSPRIQEQNSKNSFESRKHDKGKNVIMNEVAPIIIKDNLEEYQCNTKQNSHAVKGRIKEGMPEHNLVQNKYFMVKDHFNGIDELNTWKAFGAPNLRRAHGGYPVYGMGQPTLEGLRQILESLLDDGYVDIIICNMREEPVIFVKNRNDIIPYTPREADNLGENISTNGKTVDELRELEVQIRKEILDFATREENNQFYFYDDVDDFADDPHVYHLEFEEELSVVEEVYSRYTVSVPGAQYLRLPMPFEGFLEERDIDTFVNTLKEYPRLFEKDDTSLPAFVFNGHVGITRTTVGMVMGCLVLSHKRGFPQEAHKVPYPVNDRNPNFERGEFHIIRLLLEYLPNGPKVKQEVDVIIDLCGDLENVRCEILECKKKLEGIKEDYEIDGYSAKEYFQKKALKHLERYFFLIVFNSYLHEQFHLTFTLSFTDWMYRRPYLYRLLSNIDISERKTGSDLITKGTRYLVADDFIGLDVLSSFREVKVANFRKVPGLNVYGMAQPCREGLSKVVQTLMDKKHGHPIVVSFNLREDVVIDCDRETYTPREPSNLSENINMPGIEAKEIERKEALLKAEIQKNRKPIQVYQEINQPRESKELSSILTIREMYEQQMKQTPQLRYYRMPMQEECSPTEEQFDLLVTVIKDLDEINTDEDGPALLFNCHDGKDRTTTAMAIAGLVMWHKRGFPVGCKLGEQEHVSLPNAEYTKGEFICVEKLVRRLPNGNQIKREVDFILDKCSETMTPMHYHAREVIFSTFNKIKTAKTEEDAALYRRQSINYLERYIYLILFNTYLHMERVDNWEKPFTQWVEEFGRKVRAYEVLDNLDFKQDFPEDDGAGRYSRIRWRWILKRPKQIFRGQFV
ncbi:paladin-like [Ptychodera flava]|uniref:paladin-like n=1 Tax=Ptychodera flava TaxID=63121 RepID=UPI00396A4278